MPDIALETAFRTALGRRDAGLVGTPLQERYREQWRVPTVTTIPTFWGAPIDVVLPELVSCELHSYGVIEPGVTALFLDRITPGSVVFDVGAHLGYYALLGAELRADVHAFEPSNETLETLRTNVGDRVTVVPKGLWSGTTTLELKDFGPSHSAVSTFVTSRDENLREPSTTYSVPVTSVDRYVSETGAVPDLIKIDAEGAELEVLRGASETIRSARPLVTIEVGDLADERHSRDVIEYACGMGYAPFDLNVDGLRRHTIQDSYKYGNIALIPRTEEIPA